MANISENIARSVPKRQWAQVIGREGEPIVFKEIDVQQPGEYEVLVHVKFSGVCHNDLHVVNGDWPLKPKIPLVGGHEGTGIVVAKGDYVNDIELGKHVGIAWINGSCLTCDFCQQSDARLCDYAILTGYTTNGTFQQYAIADAAHVVKLESDIDLAAVAPILCAGVTVYKGLKESSAKPGQFIAIVGAGGGLGTLALQYAKAMGLRTIAIDSGEDKRDVCINQLGAEKFVDYVHDDVVKEVHLATKDGHGPHAVILVAVEEKPFQQATEYVRPKRVVVCIGLPAGAYLKASVFDSVVNLITIKCSYVGSRQNTAEAIDFFRRGLIKAPYKIVGLSELQNVYDLMAKDQVVGRYVVDTSR